MADAKGQSPRHSSVHAFGVYCMSEKSEKQEALELPSNNNSNKDQKSPVAEDVRNQRRMNKECFVCGKKHSPYCEAKWTGQSRKKKGSAKKETTERQVNKSLYEQIQKLQGEVDAKKEEEKLVSEEEENLRAIEEAETTVPFN